MTVNHNFTVDISRPVEASALGYDIISGDADSHVISVTLTDSGTPLVLTTAIASLYVVRKDGATTTTAMNITDNTVSVSMPVEAAAIPGRIYIMVCVQVSGAKLTVLYKYATVRDGITGVIVDPGDSIPSIETLLAQVAAMVLATANATDAATAANNAANVALAASTGITIIDTYATLGALESGVPSPTIGDAYGVGAASPYDVYIYTTGGWENFGPLSGADGAPGAAGPNTVTTSTTTNITGLLKGNGANVSSASAGTDYQAAITASGLLKGAGSGSVGASVAGVDYVDGTALKAYGTGIISGLEVTAQGTPNQTVAVSAGYAISPTGKYITVNANSSLAAGAANATNPRYDIVYAPDADADGVVDSVYLAGTAAATPSVPSVPSGGTYMALLYRAANDNAISSSEITNVRRRAPNATMERLPATVSNSSNTYACDMVGRDEKYFQLTNADANTKTITLSNVNMYASDAYFEIKSTSTASVTWTLDGRTVAWDGTTLSTLTTGYTYQVFAHYNSLVGKWVLRQVGSVAN